MDQMMSHGMTAIGLMIMKRVMIRRRGVHLWIIEWGGGRKGRAENGE